MVFEVAYDQEESDIPDVPQDQEKGWLQSFWGSSTNDDDEIENDNGQHEDDTEESGVQASRWNGMIPAFNLWSKESNDNETDEANTSGRDTGNGRHSRRSSKRRFRNRGITRKHTNPKHLDLEQNDNRDLVPHSLALDYDESRRGSKRQSISNETRNSNGLPPLPLRRKPAFQPHNSVEGESIL